MDITSVAQLILIAQNSVDSGRIAPSELLATFHFNTAQRALDYARDHINNEV